MKLQLVSVALGLSLTACTSSTLPEKVSNSASNTIVKTIKPKVLSTNQNNQIITLERIMADPDWLGRAPESWYWGDDSNTVYYQQKQLGNPLRDLFAKSLNDSSLKNSNGNLVSLHRHHIVKDENARLNLAKTMEVYSFEGNVFVKTLSTQKVQQLTFTSSTEAAAMFLTNGSVAYRVGNVFYAHNLNTGQIIELANLQMSEAPKEVQAPSSYLAIEQHKLIDYIALQNRNAKLQQSQKQALAKENKTITETQYYFGKDNKVAHASLSPSGDKLLVSITSEKSSRDKTDIMPNYITDDGVIAAEKVRARVANNRQYKEELFIVDLVKHEKKSLSYENLVSFDSDVLASVKKENYKRLGKTYKSVKQARHIHLLQMYNPVKWNSDGSQIAIMLEAWDNKTRWLTTVNFKDSELTTQHKLHNDAWINWSF